jgi:hypothetical protein
MIYRKAIGAFALALASVSIFAADENEPTARCPTPTNYKSAMPHLVPPETDINPTGWADLAVTISRTGNVTEASVIEWQIYPDKSWIRDWFLSGVRKLRFGHYKVARRCSLRYVLELSTSGQRGS